MMHGVDGWVLADYERTGEIGRFTYERKLAGAPLESVTIERAQPISRRRK